MSDNSLWLGDEHKIDTQGGKMKFKKRKQDKVPKSIIDAHGGEAAVDLFLMHYNRLPKDAFYVLRKEGTERPFSSSLNDEKRKGVFRCAGCGLALFSSTTKFDSGTGWPSFFDCINKEKIDFKEDSSHMMVRIEVSCKKCGAHLGHVFSDGPEPTGLR